MKNFKKMDKAEMKKAVGGNRLLYWDLPTRADLY